jgi:acyl carrier protein
MNMNDLKILVANIANIDIKEIEEDELFVDMYFWDSLKHTEFLLELESKYKIIVPISRIEKINNIIKIFNYIKKNTD